MEARLTIERKAEEDRISELLDDVLCHILSFLTTKEVIATSLLSTRWRFLWTMVPSLDVECSKPIMKFYKRVKTFLCLLRTEKITRFHLKCNSHDCCSHYVEEWVSAVVARKVEEVNISLGMCRRSEFSLAALFTCTSLVTLKIQGCFYFIFPSSVHLPNVKTLHLHINKCISFSNVTKLIIFASPALELIHLKCYHSRLEELKIGCNSRGIMGFHVLRIYGLVVHYDRDIISNSVDSDWKDKDYMTVYNINKHFCMDKIVSEILKGLRLSIEFLLLGDFRDEMDPSILDLPVFENLVELRLFLKKR